MTISAASSSDTHRVPRPRRRPPRTTRLFHGTSSRIASPAMPWAMAAHRPLGDPIATVATPVPNTSTRATRRVWLVILPAGDRRILRNPVTIPPREGRVLSRYLPDRAHPRGRIVSPFVHAGCVEPIFEAVLANDPSRITPATA